MLPVLKSRATRRQRPPAINPRSRGAIGSTRFLRDELIVRRNMNRAVIGLSGGVDSAVTAYLCARALGAENVYAIRMPYRTSSAASLSDAQLVVDALGIHDRTIDISGAVDGYLAVRAGCRCAPPRQRDGAHAHARAVRSIGEARRACRSAPETRPNGSWAISPGTPTTRRRSIRSAISSRRKCGSSRATSAFRQPLIDKAPSADLEANQTDEGDLGITYAQADAILAQMLAGLLRRAARRARLRARRRRARASPRRSHALEAPSCRRPRC